MDMFPPDPTTSQAAAGSVQTPKISLLLANVWLDRGFLEQALKEIGAEREMQLSPETNPELLEAAAATKIGRQLVTAFGEFLSNSPSEPVLSDLLANSLRLVFHEIVQNLVAYDILKLTQEEKHLGAGADEGSQNILKAKWQNLPNDRAINLVLSVIDHQLVLTVRGTEIAPLQRLQEFWSEPSAQLNPQELYDESANSVGFGSQGLPQIRAVFPNLEQSAGQRCYRVGLAALCEQDAESQLRASAA